MAVQFEIESIIIIDSGECFVFARHLTPGQEFTVTDKSFFGGIELTRYLDIPRTVNDKQRYDLFAFHIKNVDDNDKLEPNTIVELVPGNTLHYLKPWYSDETDLATQLHREINERHILYGKSVKTIARNQSQDDVLFEVNNADFKYVVVHLTWSEKALDNSEYPRTETYKHWQEVYENRIVIDHQGWENEG